MDAVLSLSGGIDGFAARQIEFELLKRKISAIEGKLWAKADLELKFSNFKTELSNLMDEKDTSLS
jgi:hypothetical protein